MIRIQQVGDWENAHRILGAMPSQIRRAMNIATLQEAHFFRRKVVEGFREQAPGGKRFKPLSPFTLAMRKFSGFSGTKALIVRGDLRNSISVVSRVAFTGIEAFVGVLRTARGKDGSKLVNIAEIHEFGTKLYAVKVTDAMRKFLMMVISRSGMEGGSGSGGLRRGFVLIKIPARPFLQPVADKFFTGPAAAARYQARVAAVLAPFLMGRRGVLTAFQHTSAQASRAARSGGGPGGGLFAALGRALGGSGGPRRDPRTGRFVRR